MAPEKENPSCAVNPGFFNLWVATKKMGHGRTVRLMITRLPQTISKRRISQIWFQSWKSLRRSAVSSVMAPQTPPRKGTDPPSRYFEI